MIKQNNIKQTNKSYYSPQLDDNEQPDHYNYRNQNKIDHKSGYMDTISNILKSQIGGTMLALPYSMSQCGIGYGLLIQIGTILLMLYAVIKLVKIADDIKKDKLYYPELVEQILGQKAGSIIACTLASLSVGSCVAYLIFFRAFINEAFYYAGVHASDFEVVLIILAILIPFIFINNFHFLSKSSAFAIALMFFTIGYILYFDMGYIKSNQDIIYQGDLFIFSGIPSFLGVAIFASEGIPCVFHIRDSMAKPQYFVRVFTGTVTFLGLTYIIFTIINIMTFGDSLNQIVLMNIPYTSWASFLAKIGFATAILLSYPIQIFPVYSMVEKTMLNIAKTVQIEDLDQIQIYKVYGMRLSILSSVFLFAYLIPDFAGILNVLGSVSGILAQFIIPLLMDNVYNKENKSLPIKIFDNFLIFLSVVFAIVCGYISAIELFSQ